MNIQKRVVMGSMKKWSAAVVVALGSIASSIAAAGTITYYHNDLLGSPVAATNAAGQVIWRESYRPYGERIKNEASSAENKVWYTSRRQDVETGLVYMGARYYDPVVGRFMGVDPRRFHESDVRSFNRYAYANNNPYAFVDPDGAQAQFFIPPRSITAAPAIGALGKPSEVQQIRTLEGFSSPGVNVQLPALGASDVINFILGGYPAVTADKLNGLIFNQGASEAPRGKAPEVFGGVVTESGFLDAGLMWLGPNPSEKSPGRYVSEDGLRQWRFGSHEAGSKPLHGHFEAYDKAGGRVVETTTVGIKPDGS